MALIDFDKFIASFITEMEEYNPRAMYIPSCIKRALYKQGLEFKDGKIVKTQRRVSAEAKETGYSESEDERIRKWIIDDIRYNMNNEPLNNSEYKKKAEKAIAWLEKQGEPKSIWHNEDEEPHKGSLILLIMQSGTPIVAKIIEPNHTFNHGERWAYIDDLLEKQGEQETLCDKCKKEHPSHSCQDITELGRCAVEHEQKPAKKVEPGFKVGDWIVSDLEDVNEDFRLCKIIGIEDGCYTIQSANGCKGYNFFEIWESDYHLWSIEDAKDGDVLIDHCDDYKNPLIFILKKFERVDFGLAQKSDYSSYCFLSMSDKPRFKKGYFHHMKDIKPATKEQRDILFQKMHEDGYTFDFEKKELKKLKFRVGDEVITENEESLTITKIDEEGYWSNDLFICDFDSECSWDLVEQKSAWTEDDDKEFEIAINALKGAGQYDSAAWLLTIKQRNRRNKL